MCKKGPKAKKLRPNILEAKFGWNLAKKNRLQPPSFSQEPQTGMSKMKKNLPQTAHPRHWPTIVL